MFFAGGVCSFCSCGSYVARYPLKNFYPRFGDKVLWNLCGALVAADRGSSCRRAVFLPRAIILVGFVVLVLVHLLLDRHSLKIAKLSDAATMLS